MVENREIITAKLCAFVRAWHSNYVREKVFDDYLAYDFMGKEAYDKIYSWIKDSFGLKSKDESEFFLNEMFAPNASRLLAKNEGIFAGSSSGAAMAAVIKFAETIESGNIVTVFPDRGDRYFSTGLYK